MPKIINLNDYRRLRQRKAQKEKLITHRQRIQHSYNWAEHALKVMQEEMPPLTDRAAVYFSFIKYARQGLLREGWILEDIEGILKNE